MGQESDSARHANGGERRRQHAQVCTCAFARSVGRDGVVPDSHGNACKLGLAGGVHRAGAAVDAIGAQFACAGDNGTVAGVEAFRIDLRVLQLEERISGFEMAKLVEKGCNVLGRRVVVPAIALTQLALEIGPVLVELGGNNDPYAGCIRVVAQGFGSGAIVDAKGPAGDDAVASKHQLGHVGDNVCKDALVRRARA